MKGDTRLTRSKQVNQEHKDRLFRLIFREREALLSLYNAVNGTDYEDSEDFTINTLEDVIYISMKNDLSFLIAGEMDLYEHQSTWNPNMPYRDLVYIADLYSGYVEEHHLDIYGSKAIRLPTPKAVVFYNGTREIPERTELKLSELYEVKCEDYCLEFKTLVLNINYGKNREIMEKCRWLHGYAVLVDRIRKYEKYYPTRVEAVKQAVEECIREGVLEDLLRKHRGEVMHSILREYDEQSHIANEKKWSYEDGYNEGRELGYSEGRESGYNEGRKSGYNEGEKCGYNRGKEEAVRNLVESLQELGVSFEATKEKVGKKYQLKEKELEAVVKKYWK